MKITALLFLISISCLAQKEIDNINGHATMYANADYKGSGFKKILVITGLHQKEENEKALRDLQRLGVTVVTDSELLPPIKEYSADEVKAICEKNGVSGLMKFEVLNKDGVGGFTRATNGRTSKVEMQLTLTDVAQNVNAVTFSGRVFARTTDGAQAIQKFIKTVSEDLTPILKKS